MNILAGYLESSVSRAGPNLAIRTCDSEPVTYAQLLERVRAIGFSLREQYGLQTGDRVAIAMSNHAAYMEILFGAWYAGLCVAPMNPRLHSKEFASMVEDCGARICFATAEIAAPLKDHLARSCAIIEIDSQEHQQMYTAGKLGAPIEVDDHATAWLFYTSGTTGRPKGAMLTHLNLDAMVQSFIADSGAAQEDTILHIAPLSHGGGLFGLVFVKQGLPQFIMPTGAFSALNLARSILLAGKVTFFAVPTMVRRLMDPEFFDPELRKNIHKIVFGGAPMYIADLRAAIAYFGAERLWGAYGQGEAPCTITHMPSAELANTQRADYEELLGSVGEPRTGVEVQVVDDDGHSVPSGTVGEVVVRGKVVMAGYWNMPEATASALNNGWLHTGDLGRMGDTGLLTLVDRSKDMIISGGTNIYPREIEEVLLLHPAVIEAAVIGVPDPDWGEVPVAYFVSSSPVSPQELESFCSDNLGRYKRPKKYLVLDELPKSSYGKILKSELRCKFLSTPIQH